MHVAIKITYNYCGVKFRARVLNVIDHEREHMFESENLLRRSFLVSALPHFDEMGKHQNICDDETK